MKEKKKIVNLLYVCMHHRIQKDANSGGIVKTKRVFELLARLYHIPRRFWHPVLREFMDIGLMEKVDSKNTKILESNIDLENTSEVYQAVGLF